jgi:hypothetical protein
MVPHRRNPMTQDADKAQRETASARSAGYTHMVRVVYPNGYSPWYGFRSKALATRRVNLLKITAPQTTVTVETL